VVIVRCRRWGTGSTLGAKAWPLTAHRFCISSCEEVISLRVEGRARVYQQQLLEFRLRHDERARQLDL